MEQALRLSKAVKRIGILSVIAVEYKAESVAEFLMEYGLNQERILDHADSLVLVPADSDLHSFLALTCDLVSERGFITLEFRDIAAVLASSGLAYINSYTLKGSNCEERLSKLTDSNAAPKDILATARCGLIQMSGSASIGLEDVEGVVNQVQELIRPDVEIVFGAAFDDELLDELRVSVLMTGFEEINSI